MLCFLLFCFVWIDLVWIMPLHNFTFNSTERTLLGASVYFLMCNKFKSHIARIMSSSDFFDDTLLWMHVCLTVYLSVCLSRFKSDITNDGIKVYYKTSNLSIKQNGKYGQFSKLLNYVRTFSGTPSMTRMLLFEFRFKVGYIFLRLILNNLVQDIREMNF